VLGRIRLRLGRILSLPAARLGLFEVAGQSSVCLPRLRQAQAVLRSWWRQRRKEKRDPYNFRISPLDLRALAVLYICPRPVFLVSCSFQGADNLFPMDLVGTVVGGYFLLSLRSTSPAIRLMTGRKQMALCTVSPSAWPIVHELGKHHRKERMEWSALPFARRSSPALGLPVPEPARSIREVTVEHVDVVGSHTLFVTRIVTESHLAGGPVLHHISGLYHAYLVRQGRPPQNALP
jgi:flavin reductase (DIM6/NTAB) family NADH-FMN oxidoreductase RutF